MKKEINTIEELLRNAGYDSEKNIDWKKISIWCVLSEEFIEKYQNKVNWFYISKHQILSEPFIEKYKDKVEWFYISQSQVLSESFIEKYKDKINWENISNYQILSEDFIEKYYDKVDWYYISRSQILSEPFIEKYENKFDWVFISMHQTLSESFIEKFEKKVAWICVSKFQNLSKKFVEKYKSDVYIDEYNKCYKYFTQKFDEIQRFKNNHNLHFDYQFFYGYVSFDRQNRLISFNKPIVFDKINHYYKFHWEKRKIDSERRFAYDKLVKISINDLIIYESKCNSFYIKGFTVINDIPKKQYYNKFQLIEI